jgi:hypothetical protein
LPEQRFWYVTLSLCVIVVADFFMLLSIILVSLHLLPKNKAKKPKNTIQPVFESGDELLGALRRLGASLCVLYSEGRFDIVVMSGETMARLKTKLTCPAIQRFNSEAT